MTSIRRRAAPEAEEAAATVICYAAIANALVFHHENISQHSYEKLQEAYWDLEEKDWIPSELKNLFQRAGTICRQRRRAE